VIPYKKHFINATKKYWPEEVEKDANFYLWFVAQAKVESNLDPKLVSRAGFYGMMQLMLHTWYKIKSYLPHLSKSILDGKSNIEAGIWYDRFYCYDRLAEYLDGQDRLLAMFAAYNCGISQIKKIIEENEVTTYVELEKHIRYRDTVEYVKKIVKYKKEWERLIK